MEIGNFTNELQRRLLGGIMGLGSLEDTNNP